MKYLALIVVALGLAACEYKRETVQPAATSAVVTPAPASSTTVTVPAWPSATSTTVYAR